MTDHLGDPGPDLDALTRRLAETPPEFLDEPRCGEAGRVAVPALVNDVLLMHGARAGLAALQPFTAGRARTERNRLALVMIAAWLLADQGLVAAGLVQRDLLRVLDEAVAGLAPTAPAHQFVVDPERREELARVVLAALGLRPRGETPAQAADRLSGISGAERRRLLENSRAAEQRAREIRAALVRKVADESADKWSRE